MKIQVLIAAVISSFILYGCEDNETNYLELSESSFSNVDGDGATLTVSVTSDVEWQISKTAQWCNVTPSKGFGNRSVPANTIQAINSLQIHSREMDISLSDGVPKRMAAILFMEMVQQYQIFPLQMEQQ